MTISEQSKLELLSFDIEKLPLSEDGTAMVDFYVHLPRNDKFIRFVLKGDRFGSKHGTMLKQHAEPMVFCKFDAFQAHCNGFSIPESEHNRLVQEFAEDPEKFRKNYPHLVLPPNISNKSQANETEEESSRKRLDPADEKSSKLILLGKNGENKSSASELQTFKTTPEELEALKAAKEKTVFSANNDLATPPKKKKSNKEDEGSSKQSHTTYYEDQSSSRHTIVHEEEDYSGSRKSLTEPNPNDAATLDEMMSQFGQEQGSYLTKTITGELQSIFKGLTDSNTSVMNLEESPIEEISSNLLQLIAPEVEKLRDYLINIPNYVGVMNDSAALTAITTLVCMARGQTSRSIFREMSYAVLLMDIALGSLDEEGYKTYFLNPNSLSEAQKKIVFNHPRAAYELVQKRFKNLPDIVGQLILGHHELFSGKGYPRKVRSELLAPLVRLLAFAVDVFEIMKRAHFKGEKVSIMAAVESLLNADVAPHQRRHNIVLMREVHAYLKADQEN